MLRNEVKNSNKTLEMRNIHDHLLNFDKSCMIIISYNLLKYNLKKIKRGTVTTRLPRITIEIDIGSY